MPMVVAHPTIPGAYQVVKLPSETNGSIGTSVALSKIRTKATDTITATVTLGASVNVATDVSVVFSPSYGSQVTAGAFTPASGIVTSFTFPINIVKTGSPAEYPIVVSVNIAALTGAGTGSAQFVVDTLAPNTPTGFSGIVGKGSVTLNWSPVADLDIDHYNVYESATTTPPGSYTNQVYGTFFAETGLTPGTIQYYWVSAVDRTGNESALSSRVDTIPLGDIGVALTLSKKLVGGSYTFDNAVGDGLGISIDTPVPYTALTLSARRASDGSDVTGSIVTFSNLLVSDGASYKAFTDKIVVLDAATETAQFIIRVAVSYLGQTGGGEFALTVRTNVPATITPLGSAVGLVDAVRVVWPASTDLYLSYYNVYRNTTANNPSGATFIGKTVDNVYIDGNIPPGTQPTYYYFVTQVDQAGNESAKQTTGNGEAGSARSIITGDVISQATGLSTLQLTLNSTVTAYTVGSLGGHPALIAPQIVAGDIAANAIVATKLSIVSAAWDPGAFLYPNNPSAGLVSWNAFNLVKSGVAYSISANLTGVSKKVIWWDKSVSTTTLQADDISVAPGNAAPTAGSFEAKFNPDEDVVLGFNKSGAFQEQWGGTVIDGNQLLVSSITAGKINTSEISAVVANLGAVYAGRIADNSDPTASYRGIRITKNFTDSHGTITYNKGSHWDDATGYYIDLAADPTAASPDSIFMKAGSFMLIDIGTSSGRTPFAKFSGSLFADILQVPSTPGGSSYIGSFGASGIVLSNSTSVSTPGVLVRSDSLYSSSAANANQVSIGVPFKRMSDLNEYSQYDAVTVWSSALSLPNAYIGSYTVAGAGSNSNPSLATEFPTATQTVSRTSYGVSAGTTLTESSVDLGTSSGGVYTPGPTDKKYTFRWTLRLNDASIVPSATPVVTIGTATASYSTANPPTSSWTAFSTRTITHIFSSSGSNDETVEYTDIADFTGSSNPTHLAFKVEFSDTITANNISSGTSTATVTAVIVSWYYAGASTTIRNLRMNAADGNPHMTLEPVTVPGGGFSGGRKGDVIMGSDGNVHVHNGTIWKTIAYV